MASRTELINRLPNDLRESVKYAEAAIYDVLRQVVDQYKSGEIMDEQVDAAVVLLERAVHPESIPVSERG